MTIDGLNAGQLVIREFMKIEQTQYPNGMQGYALKRMAKKDALRLYCGEPAIRDLLEIIKNEEELSMRMFAVHIFMSSKREELVFDGLLLATEDESSTIREMACKGIVNSEERMKSPRVIEPLLKRLVDSDPDVRSTAAKSIAITNSPRAIDALIEALSCNKGKIAKSIASSLNSITGKKFLFGNANHVKWQKWRKTG